MKITAPKNVNYCATIVKVSNIIPLPNCDNVVAAIVCANQVVVDKDTKIGDIGIFFPVETKLSEKYCHINNLNNEAILNKDITKKGYISKGRIKCVKFRNNKSEGLFMPLTSFIGIVDEKDLTDFKVGMEFDEIDGEKICEKYIPGGSKVKGQGNAISKYAKDEPKFTRLVEEQFKFHIDTAQLKKNMWHVSPMDVISLTDKWHGCVSGDTEVETLEYGKMIIKDIVYKKLNCNIKSFDFVKNEVVYVPVDQFYFKPDDGEWFEIELENGAKLKITGNNPVYIPELGGYIEVSKLKEGMDVVFMN